MIGLTIEPVTGDRWDDVLELFGENGAYSNCWCTWWLLTASAWDAASPIERRRVLESKIGAGDEPGLLAYHDGAPVGWCAVGPRRWYGRLNSKRSRVFRPIDDLDTWVVNCFFTRKDHRRAGIASRLLDAAIRHATAGGAGIIEAYPVDRETRPSRSADLFVGTLTMFLDAGFVEVSRAGGRPLVRKYLGSTP